jgi:hypothetical protein
MRALLDASACVLSARPLDLQLRLRSLVLPAVVVAAAAIHAPSASAFSKDLRWQDAASAPQAVRRVIEVEEQVRPRRRAGRRHTKSQRRGYRQARPAGRLRPRAVAVRAARERLPAAEAGLRLAAVDPTVDVVPLEQRSLVANHPLLPDAPAGDAAREIAAAPAPGAETASPRCQSTHIGPLALAVASFTRDFRASEPAMVEGVWPHCRGARNPQSSWHLASLGSAPNAARPSAGDDDGPSGWSIHWRASSECLAGPLRAVLKLVADEFGPLTVNSTCRSRAHNARVGGAPRSYHLTGNAVDFRVRSNYSEVLKFLARFRSVGGLTHYGAGVFHIDTGPRRTWGPNSWGRRRT